MRKLTTIFVVSVAVNYVWEIAQAPLYVGMAKYNFALLRHCFIASLGDGVMLLMIVLAGWIILQRQNWFERPGAPGYLVMLITGLILGGISRMVRVACAGSMAIHGEDAASARARYRHCANCTNAFSSAAGVSNSAFSITAG